MSKTVTINQDKLLMLKETVASDSNITSHNDYCSELTEATPEVDEYEIGDEGSNPPVGGNYYHVNESYNVSVRGGLDSINTIEFIPHENAREEGYEDDEIEDFEPYYDIEAMDMNGSTILYANLTVSELFDYFPQSIINDIVERDNSNATKLTNPQINLYRIDDILYRDTTPSDVNNVEEVNRIAKKIQTGGPSAYLLTDGDIIYFHDHIYINNIDGITPDKFIALGNIRLSNGGFELIKEPTRQQMYELKQWIRQQDGGIYVDFCEESHQTYPRTLFSTKYGSPNAERIVNDIYYYFEEGIKPQDNFYESKDKEKVLENFDFEVDSSEIDLSSFKKKHELVPNIWNPDGKLNSRVRLKLLDIADDFWKFVNLKWVKPQGILLTGSICDFNQSQNSEINLHLIVDFDEIDEKTEFVEHYLDSKKNEWDNEHGELQIMGYNIGLYIHEINDALDSNGIYDLEENDWIKEPNFDDSQTMFENKSIKEYITLLKNDMVNEEWVADGNSEHNPYKKRWAAERKALKDFVSNFGKLMQSKENGKLYKCYYDKVLSQLVGFNYCICLQWDNIEMKPKSILYIRALDKFSPNIKQVNYDYRGKDNMQGTYDDLSYRNY